MNNDTDTNPDFQNFSHHTPQAALPMEKVRIFGVLTVRDILLGLSLVSLAIAMLGAVFLVGQVLWGPKEKDAVSIMDSIHIIMPLLLLTYAIGCGMAIVSVRRMRSLTLPWILDILTWFIITGIVIFYMYVLARLWMESYTNTSLIKFALVLGGAFFVLFGIQLGTHHRSLIRFIIPLLLMNLVHLFALVFRYVLLYDHVNQTLFKYDIGFFLGMVFVSIFMARGTAFRRIQNLIDRLFEVNPNQV